MNLDTSPRRADYSALKVNQSFIAGLLVLAFVLNVWPLVAGVGLVMLVGTAFPSLALFQLIYRHILRPSGWVKAHVIEDNPEPHRFAQGFGGTVLAIATVAFLLGAPLVGWVLGWLVAILAAVNLFLGFCAGCFVYYQLNRLGLGGFFRYSPVRRS